MNTYLNCCSEHPHPHAFETYKTIQDFVVCWSLQAPLAMGYFASMARSRLTNNSVNSNTHGDITTEDPMPPGVCSEVNSSEVELK